MEEAATLDATPHPSPPEDLKPADLAGGLTLSDLALQVRVGQRADPSTPRAVQQAGRGIALACGLWTSHCVLQWENLRGCMAPAAAGSSTAGMASPPTHAAQAFLVNTSVF